jgi:hypothetical protein
MLPAFVRHVVRATPALVLLSMLCAAVPKAHAKDAVEECLSASENGQKLRQKASLREARAKFQACSEALCPSIVQRNCTTWLSEVTALLPTVTLSAKSPEGKDLVDVTVSLDGKPLQARLDGKAIQVDPGVHIFRFELDGESPLEERVVLNEGDKGRNVVVQFGKKKELSPPVVVAATRPFPLGPVLLGSLGLAAVATGAVLFGTGSADYPSECDRTTIVCTTTAPIEAQKELADRATSADNRMRVGLWTMIGGGAVTLGAIAWLVVDRAVAQSGSAERQASWSQQKAQPRFIPLLGLGSAGIRYSF